MFCCLFTLCAYPSQSVRIIHLLQNGVHRLARLAPGSKEIDQNKLATVYYIIECLHNYLSII